MQYRKILLASHGTKGARAAEKLAFALCRPGTRLEHLLVVPDFWKGMMGDDWLNNASIRDVYGKYIESRLADEARRHIDRLRKEAGKRRVRYRVQVVFGKPADCLLERVARDAVDLVVMGSPRPRGQPGLRSRMLTDAVLKSLRTPLYIAAYPHG